MALPNLTNLTNGITQLRIPIGGDLDFDVTWDGNDIAVVNEAKAFDQDDNELLDFVLHIAVVGGVAEVRVPRAVTELLVDDLEPWETGAYWKFIATSTSGSTKLLIEGPVQLHPRSST